MKNKPEKIQKSFGIEDLLGMFFGETEKRRYLIGVAIMNAILIDFVAVAMREDNFFHITDMRRIDDYNYQLVFSGKMVDLRLIPENVGARMRYTTYMFCEMQLTGELKLVEDLYDLIDSVYRRTSLEHWREKIAAKITDKTEPVAIYHRLIRKYCAVTA